MKNAIKRHQLGVFFYILKILLCLFIFGILLVFIVGPLLTMFTKFNLDDIKFVFHDNNFYKSLGNSIWISLVSALITTILAVISAFLLNEADIKHKNVLVLFLTLPMLIPTISIGLGIRLLFGVNGYLDRILGIAYDAVGKPFGLLLGSVLVSFPFSFLLVYDSLKYENKTVYDACQTLGISRFSSFFKVTLPFLFPAIISTFFASFTLTFSDYGVPMEIAGNIKTLPMYLYELIQGIARGRLAIIGIIMIMPAIIAFIIDLFFKTTSEENVNKQLIKPRKSFNICAIIILSIFIFILLLPQLSFVITSFVKRYPNDLSLSFEHIQYVFAKSSGVSVGRGFLNSFIMALFTALFGTALTYLDAYFCVRSKLKIAKPLDLLSISPLSIPGLVIGVGFLIMFSNTGGWFYGTMAILITVNIFHFFSSPYLMAKNAFAKVNQNFETVGETLGISNVSIFFKVILPNTTSTIIQMFSYYFMNSMITISAVALLFSFQNQPLSIFINNYTYREQQYENAAVISFIILLANGIFKTITDVTVKIIDKKHNYKGGNNMILNHYQFDVLTYIERKSPFKMTQRELSDRIRISLGNTNKILKDFLDKDYIDIKENKEISITKNGLKALEPYKVKKAIIIAAGFGHRLAPVTLDTAKPLVKVNGRRIIDSIIDAFVAADIKDITVVRGYKKEQFDVLLKKYPFIKFIDNNMYNECNDIASLYCARDIIDRCYISDGDLNIMNPAIITKYQYATCNYGAPVKKTDDWCLFKKGNYINKVAVGGVDCYRMIGISYWDEKDSEQLKKDVVKVFNSHGGHEQYRDNIALKICKKNYKIEIKECFMKEVIEIDNYSELCDMDPSYIGYKSK